MKKQSLILVAIMVASIFSLQSCKKDEEAPTPEADQFDSLSEIVEALKTDPQTFTVADPTVFQSITGEDGTVLNIQANSFLDMDGNPLTTPVTVELNEYLELEDMLRGNVQTTSNGRILVTGGSFDFNAKDENGNDVSLNPWSVSTQIPVQTDITGFENDMQYYRGTTTVVDGREMVDWTLGENQEWWMDSSGIFEIYGIDLGLTNCDVLYDLAGEDATQFEVTVDGVSDYANVSVWMVIDDFPSVVMITSQNDAGTALETYEASIPLGMNGTLLAIHSDEDGYLKFGSLPITVAGDDSFAVSTDYGTMDELAALITSLTD